MIALVLLLACAKKPEVVDPAMEPELIQPVPRNGSVVDGRYVDGSLPLTVPIPEGWNAEPGPVPSHLRVSLREPTLGVRVEVWSYDGVDRDLRPREGCLWTFVDDGNYSSLVLAEASRAASCTPDEPEGARVFAYVVVHSDVTYHLEATVPEKVLVPGKEATLRVMNGIRWTDGSPPPAQSDDVRSDGADEPAAPAEASAAPTGG